MLLRGWGGFVSPPAMGPLPNACYLQLGPGHRIHPLGMYCRMGVKSSTMLNLNRVRKPIMSPTKMETVSKAPICRKSGRSKVWAQ